MDVLADTKLTEARTSASSTLYVWKHAAVFLVSCVIIVARRPDAVLHAQFFAEDGAIWFAEAYNWGAWKALFFTYNGYIHLLPRLAAALAVLAPLKFAPLIENLIAIAIEALPVNLLMSDRSASWGTLRFRAILAAMYLVLPNTSEIIGTVTEAQWLLALCAVLILIGTPSRSTLGKVFDSALLLLCSLTGPFCFFLLPISFFATKQRNRLWRYLTTGIFLLGSLVQASALILHYSNRHTARLGASLKGFVQMLTGQVYLGALVGTNSLSTRLHLRVLLAIFVVGSIIAFSVARSSKNMRLLWILAASAFIASLASPITPQIGQMTAWDILLLAPGSHYWFLPTLAFAWSVVFCIASRHQILQIVGGGMALLMIFGLIRDFRYPPFPDEHFAQYASRLDATPSRGALVIPVYPEGWHADLVKR